MAAITNITNDQLIRKFKKQLFKNFQIHFKLSTWCQLSLLSKFKTSIKLYKISRWQWELELANSITKLYPNDSFQKIKGLN